MYMYNTPISFGHIFHSLVIGTIHNYFTCLSKVESTVLVFTNYSVVKESTYLHGYHKANMLVGILLVNVKRLC